MQIMDPQLPSKATADTKSTAGLKMEERAQRQGRHCTFLASQPHFGGEVQLCWSSCALHSLGSLLKWGLMDWAEWGARGRKSNPDQGEGERFLDGGKI